MTLKVYHAYYRKLRDTEKRKEKVKITVILLPIDNYYEEFLVFSLPDCFLCFCVTHTHMYTHQINVKDQVSYLFSHC